jgi:hypothetical protein
MTNNAASAARTVRSLRNMIVRPEKTGIEPRFRL